MKRLLAFLMKWKWTLIFPFGSLFIWFTAFISSAGERIWPYLFNKALEYFTQNSNAAGTTSFTTLITNVGWFINGLNAWIPIWDVFNFAFFIIAWRLSFMAVRFFIKALTLGQV